MDAVLNLRRDPPFSIYVWSLWSRVPSLLWIAAALFEYLILTTTRGLN